MRRPRSDAAVSAATRTATLAIIAGTGSLPLQLVLALEARGELYLLAEIDGFPIEVDRQRERFRVERLALFIDRLHDLGIMRVVFAGAVRRPRLDPALFDPFTAAMVPRLVAAMQAGDEATLREVIAIFEECGFEVVGADAIAPDLVPGPGVLGRYEPGDADRADVARAEAIVAALGSVDVGQGAVVAQGLCLAVEALPGTDAMLAEAARHAHLRPDPDGAGGVLLKAVKPGQDRRVDLPTLGLETLRMARAAGLAGIAFQAGGVLLLDRAEMVAEADECGMFLWSKAL